MKTRLKRLFNLALVLLFFSTTSFGQNYKADVSKGDFALKKGDFEAAAKTYAAALKPIKPLGKGNLDVLYKLGFSQMQIKDYVGASTSFAQYIGISKNVSGDINKLKDVIQWKDWCDGETNNLPVLSSAPNSNLYLTNMRTLNSTLNDLSITLDSRNEIIFFASNKVYFDEKKLIDIKTNLFTSEYQSNELTTPIKIGAEINSLGEIISACLAPDNKTLYFTVTNEDQTKADIYVCKYRSGKCENTEKLPKVINSKYFDGYPSISSDGKAMYFVSDRPGGFGGKDIYVTRILPDGSWSEPYNLGKTVNSKYDEITPHIDATNETLYFSSKGHPGNGGFDIFYSKMTNKSKWGAPINMVEPINSKSDDISYITTTDPNICYLSSSRKGGSGNYDIYKVGKKEPTNPADEKPVLANNSDVKKDSVSKPNNFDEFKKIAEKEKQNQTANPKTETQLPTIKEQPKPSGQPVVQNQKPVQSVQPVTTEKTVPKQTTESKQTNTVATNTNTKSIQKPSSGMIPNEDTAILNSAVRGLYFKVQLGAFRNHVTVNSPYFDKLNKRMMNEELSEEMLYKYTIGTFESVSRGTNAKMALRTSGYPDAFLACYFEGKRITMDEALKMLDKKVYNRMAYNKK